jgi:branched-subunit amino acid transport protein
MNSLQFFSYLLIIAGSTYLIRAIPFAAVRKKIENRFIRSFLYYIPYAVLAAMTFPAALYATGNVAAAAIGIIAAVILQ